MTTTAAPRRGSRTPDAEGKIACTFCATRIKANGVGRHEAQCAKNPARNGSTTVEQRARTAARTKLAELEEALTGGPATNDPAHCTEWSERARRILTEYRTLEAVIHG